MSPATIPPAAAALSLAALLAIGDAARAEDECGPAEPGAEVRCTASGYDAQADGNIAYRPGPGDGDFSLRLEPGLSVSYDSETPDDELGRDEIEGYVPIYRSAAVLVVPGDAGYTGDIAVSSFADVTASGRFATGYLVWQFGAPGDVRLDIDGGSVTTGGDRTIGVFGSHVLSEGDLVAGLKDAAVLAEGDRARGVLLQHNGTGDIGFGVRGGSIGARGSDVNGFFAGHFDHGGLTVDLLDAAVSAEGDDASGIYIQHTGAGDIGIGSRGGSISARGNNANGFIVSHFDAGSLAVDLLDPAVSAEGDYAYGINIQHAGAGDIDLGSRGGSIGVRGNNVNGFFVGHFNAGGLAVDLLDVAVSAEGDRARGIRLQHGGAGDIGIEARGGRVDAVGMSSIGLLGLHAGTGNFAAGLQDVAVSATGDLSRGILLLQTSGPGDLAIDIEGGSVGATGDGADGILLSHQDEGRIAAQLRNVALAAEGEMSSGARFIHKGTGDIVAGFHDATVAASGSNSFGILVQHETGEGSIRIHVDGGSVRAEDPGGIGIDVGVYNPETGALSRVAGIGQDGYRRQHVIVDGEVLGGSDDGDGDAAGIWLGGGGRIAIGPRGSVGAASGTAIRVYGEGALLQVGADFDGRRAEDVFDGAIVNDDGRTAIVVNGVTLHDAMTGATGHQVPNGARDVTMAASSIIAGRSFTAADFVTGPHAPRAAIYETLPGLLLRLDGRAVPGERFRRAGSPAWVRVAGGRGSHEPERASVGASYDFDRFAVEAGRDFGLSESGTVTGSASLRHVRGSADVSAPTGGGRVEAGGFGVSLGAAWRNDADAYANGRVSITRYEADLRSSARGPLKEGANAMVRTLRVEAGRRLGFGETASLTPRAWLAHTDVSLDGFRDAVGSRVSSDGAERSDVGAGIVAGTARALDGGTRSLSLRGELGVERTLGDAETVVDVSGERLHTEAAGTRIVLGLAGTYRWDRYSLGGTVSASGAGSDDRSWAASLRFAMRF